MASDTKTKPPQEKRAITRARRDAEIQLEYQEKMHRLNQLRQRIKLAQGGVHAYSQGRISDAVQNFQSYLRILEDWKGVDEGKLTPSLFDRETDVAELLLISGVYWDLSKLYDRTRSAGKQKEFHHYLDKYIMFSRGMPFQHVCLETMRKYISNDKPVHTAAFKGAFKVMGGELSPCFVATSLVDVCDEATLPRLRVFRDRRLQVSGFGRAFIRWYYRNGETMAGWADRQPRALRRTMGLALDWVAKLL